MECLPNNNSGKTGQTPVHRSENSNTRGRKVTCSGGGGGGAGGVGGGDRQKIKAEERRRHCGQKHSSLKK